MSKSLFFEDLFSRKCQCHMCSSSEEREKSDNLYIHSKCHPNHPPWAVVNKNNESVDFYCSLCNKMLTSIKIEKLFKNSAVYSDGKISSDDEGEIELSINGIGGKIIIEFQSKVKWIGLTSNEARQIAKTLIEFADDLDPKFKEAKVN